MNWIVAKLAEMFLAKKAIFYLGTLNAKLVGKRTVIGFVMLALNWLLQGMGLISKEDGDSIQSVLLGSVLITFSDKITRYAPLKEKVLEQLKKQASLEPK